MSYTHTDLISGKEIMDFSAIQRSAGTTANVAYLEKYGIDKSRDPEWVIGGERHSFWLNIFDKRWEALLLNPNQG